MHTQKAQYHTAIDRGPLLATHFDDMEQQKAASVFGMWLFLVTEIMFFGGFFLTYIVYRGAYPAAFAEASSHLDVTAGTFNTFVLLTSSLTMALAVHAAAAGKNKQLARFLMATLVLGALFLGIKLTEYYHKYETHEMPVAGLPFHYHGEHEEGARLFYSLYFAMTGMHALHMIIGIVALLLFILAARKNRYSPTYYTPIEVMGLYWHFVDIVWIFLFPLLYLIDRTTN